MSVFYSSNLLKNRLSTIHLKETSVAAVHFLGAALCFGLGTIYLWVQVTTLLLLYLSVAWVVK